MKKTILAALALATAGFCAVSEPVSQVTLLRGCGTDAGKTAFAISSPAFPGGYYTPQLIVTSDDPLYANILSEANQSIVTGKNFSVEYTGAKTVFNYQTTSFASGCYPSSFVTATNFSLKR